MNKNLWLLKRIFILGIIFIFFSSSYSYAIRPKRARGKATTLAAQRNHRLREKSKSRHPVATHAPARPGSAKPAGSRKTTYTQSDDLTAEVNAEIARQRRTRAKKPTAKRKTKQEWIAEYNTHPEELHAGTPMYAAFSQADQRVKKAEQNNETVDPLDKQMSDIYRATIRYRKD